MAVADGRRDRVGAVGDGCVKGQRDRSRWVGASGPFFRSGTPSRSTAFWREIGRNSLVTLAYAVCGTSLCVLLGLVWGLLSAEVGWQRWQTMFPPRMAAAPWLQVRAVLALPRAIHDAIWELLWRNVLGLDPLVAILAIAMPFGAIAAKVFAEILDETPRAPLHALLAAGAPPGVALCYSILPQAFLNLLSYSFYRFECAMRSAAVLGIIGAGGLGYQLALSLQALRYEQVWPLLGALVVLTGLTDAWSSLLRRRLGAPSRLDLNVLDLPGRSTVPRSRGGRDPWVWASALLAIALLALWTLQPNPSHLWSPRALRLFGQLLRDWFPPDFSRWSVLWQAAWQTLAMSILAIAIAGLGGVLLALPASRNITLAGGMHGDGGQTGWVTFIATRTVLLVGRAVPEPAWALLLLFVMFPGILPGAIALGVHNLGILGRLMAEVVENTDDRPFRALAALGASRLPSSPTAPACPDTAFPGLHPLPLGRVHSSHGHRRPRGGGRAGTPARRATEHP